MTELQARVTLDSRELRMRRAAAQLLAGEADRSATLGTASLGPEAIVRHLLAVQAQDPFGARLALRARSEGLTVSDVDRALTEDRSILVTWVNRGTLHLVRPDDFPWLLALTAPTLVSANRHRLGQEGIPPDDAERGVAVIEKALAEDGPLSRRELTNRVAAAGIRTAGQAMVHLLFAASLRGLIVRGPMVGNSHAFVLVRDWLGAPAPSLPGGDRDRALAELARRYLTGHSPASDRDLAYWSGLPLRDARAGLRAIGSELVELGDGLVELAGLPEAPGRLPARLLGVFDETTVGFPDRRWLVARAHSAFAFSGGVFRALATIDGRAVATWGARRTDGALAIQLQPFDPLSPEVEEALAVEARDVARFEGRRLESLTTT
jgi:hypothetical protein